MAWATGGVLTCFPNMNSQIYSENITTAILTAFHKNPVAVQLLICLGEVSSVRPKSCLRLGYNRKSYKT